MLNENLFLEGIWKNLKRKSNYLEYIYCMAQYSEKLHVYLEMN